jgi:hypothetical protein
MIYQQVGVGSYYAYPNHDVAPDKKGADWCRQYAQAAYYDWTFAYPKGVFANNGGDYEKYRLYALGKQPITPYKKWLGIDPLTDNTWMSVDWTPRPIVSGYRDKAISRLMKEDFGVVCTPIDMLAKTEETAYYSDMKAKLAIRQIMLQQNPELASHPLIAMQSGDPLDLEELEMRVSMGEQFNRSKDAELAIALGFYENNYRNARRQWYEDLFDYGVAGKKDWLGDDNKAKFRRVDPRNVIVSYSKDGSFSDTVHAGEMINVSLIELALQKDENGNPLFSEQELQEFAGSIAGKFGNPSGFGMWNSWGWVKPYDKFKCQVMDIEFFTYNTYSYYDAKDELGNSDYRKAANGRGKKSDKYQRKRIQYVYKCKWIVGTEKCYDWGMCYDQKRSSQKEKKAKTRLSYTFYAYNFHEMRAQSMMARLVPYIDDYQLTVLRIQNWKNRCVPGGHWINLDNLENVALNKGGANMQPKELLQMFYETGILVGRSMQANGEPLPGNIQPIIPIENSLMSELQGLYNDLINTVMTIERMTGYNDVTSGNPNPKTLVPGYEMANMSTNDALYPLAFAEEQISLQLAEDVLCRMQQGLRKGGISGYAPALNSNTLRAIQLNPDISLRDYGIELEKKTSDDQKMWLLQQMQQDIANGFLDTSDAVILVNTKNVKQAQAIWSFRVKRTKEALHAQKMQELQMTNQGNLQTTMAAAQAKQQETNMVMQFELQKKQMEVMGELKKEEMRLQAQIQMKAMELGVKDKMNAETNETKENVAGVTGQAKIIAAHVDQNTKAISTQLAGEYSLEKQHIANKKPATKSK